MKNNKKEKTKLNLFTGIIVLLTGLTTLQLIKLNALPIKYLIALISFLILMCIFIAYTQKKEKPKVLHQGGKVISVLLSILLLVGNLYLYKTGSFLSLISGGDEMIDTVSVIVKKENPAESIEEILDANFGIEDNKDQVVLDTISHINTEYNADLMISEFNSYGGLVKYLYDEKVGAVIINEAFRDFILEDHPTFNEDTKIIYSHKIKTEISKPSNKNVTKDSFNILISGIDVYGAISNNSRSDVNILATINPNSKDILLTAIPRDYYLPMPCQGGATDKLTHSGIYGVSCTMETIGNALGVDVDHFIRVNFSSFTQVIDVLGGVDVVVDEAFSAGGYSFPAGINHMDGTKALVFVRDRYHQSGGDRDRGKNQMKVISAVIQKAMSPQIITNYMGILSSVEGSFQTSLSSKQITSLVQMQLNDMSSWNTIEQRVDGYNANDYSPALGFNVYVMYPDNQSIEQAKYNIRQLANK